MKDIVLNKIPVRFDEEPHTYTNTQTGEVYNGITGTLIRRVFPNKYKFVDEETLRKAAEHGSKVHREIEEGESFGAAPEEKEAQNYFALKEREGLVCITTEYTVSDMEHYATNIDGVYDAGDGTVILADYKTTSKFDRESVSWQLSICAQFFEMNNPELKVSKLIGIWLRGEIAEVIEVKRKTEKEILDLIACDQEGRDYEVAQVFPSYFSDMEAELETLTRRIKELTAEADAIKAELLVQMGERGDKSFDTGSMLVTYVAPSKSSRFDSTRFKKEHADLYSEYMKESETKASLKITIR